MKIIIVSSTAAVTLKIDPSVVLATRQYVDDQIIQVKAYVDQQLAAHITASDPHTQYLLESDFDKYFPVGFPLPWPQATPPGGWLKCNGATFDKVKYPKLATAYPSGTLPDLRGEFLRGWDDGRGVDSGRGILTGQADALKSHAHNSPTAGLSSPGAGTYEVPGAMSNNLYADYDYFRAAPTEVTGGNETRPRNVAYNYIVRAA